MSPAGDRSGWPDKEIDAPPGSRRIAEVGGCQRSKRAIIIVFLPSNCAHI